MTIPPFSSIGCESYRHSHFRYDNRTHSAMELYKESATMSANQSKVNEKNSSRAQLLTFKLLAVVFGSSLALLGCELAIRILAPQALASDIVIGDDDVDYRLRPNAQGRMTSPEYSARIHIN